jgi:hypothetical protein
VKEPPPRASRATVFRKERRRCAPVQAKVLCEDEKPSPGAENADQIQDFSFWRAARQSAQKRSAECHSVCT